MEIEQPTIEEAARWISAAGGLLLSAGAGMGVDSGLPDFRGNEGFWRAYPAYARLGLSFVDLANPSWFDTDPGRAWGFYGHRLNLYRQTVPHRGFELLLKWGKACRDGFFVYTSNVDGQFQKAGFPHDSIEEHHGSIHHLQCTVPCSRSIESAVGLTIEVAPETFRARPPFPRCPQCGELSRPNILMFGDGGWIADRSEAQSERFHAWLRSQRKGGIVIVECGAGTAIPAVRGLSESLVSSGMARLIRINVREPRVPPGQLGIASSALAALLAIDKCLNDDRYNPQ